MRTLPAAKLEQLIDSSTRPVVVCVTRKGAASSRALLDAAAQLAPELGQRFELVQVDMDADPGRMDALRIAREPELLLYAGGRIFERTEGAMSAAQLAAFLEHALGELPGDDEDH